MFFVLWISLNAMHLSLSLSLWQFLTLGAPPKSYLGTQVMELNVFVVVALLPF